jgi:hypothetical protein
MNAEINKRWLIEPGGREALFQAREQEKRFEDDDLR